MIKKTPTIILRTLYFFIHSINLSRNLYARTGTVGVGGDNVTSNSVSSTVADAGALSRSTLAEPIHLNISSGVL
jgi:hypothetical protein